MRSGRRELLGARSGETGNLRSRRNRRGYVGAEEWSFVLCLLPAVFRPSSDQVSGGPGCPRCLRGGVRFTGHSAQGSDLAVFFDVMIHSDEFWLDHYGPESFGLEGAAKSWKKFKRFLCLTAVDGLSGGLAGLGYGSIGGPGGATGGFIVGTIVGGLSSWGANDILFN